MDVRNELDLQFLDMCDLNDKDKNELLEILKSDTLKLPWDPTENNNEPNFVSEVSEIENNWHHNTVTEESYMKYASENDIVLPTMLPAHTYPPQMMTTMCNDWAGHMFMNNVPADPHVTQFMPGLGFPCVSYNIGTDAHEVTTPIRENGRRNNRGKGMRRDNFNCGMNSANEMQSAYVTDQGQYHQVPTVMYLYPEHPMSPQQHQVAGPIYYAPAMYSPSALPPHPSSYGHPHPPYPSHHNQRYIQQSNNQPTMMPQPNQDCQKAAITKQYEKRTPKAHVPSKVFYPPSEEDSSSSQTNIIATLIVKNCQLDTGTDDAQENHEKKSANNNNKVPPVNVTIEHNIVSTVNETCNGTEKKDIPCVNINSSIEVKQNGDTDKDYKNETVSSIKTTVVKTLSKSTSKNEEKEMPLDESTSTKSTQEKVILLKEELPTRNDPTTGLPCNAASTLSSVTTSAPPAIPTSISITPTVASVPSSPPVTAPTMSWAGILKKRNSDVTLTPSNCKPTAKITPLPAEGGIKTAKSSIIPNHGEHHESHICSTNSTSESLQNRCDDPRILQMGAFLLKYQMDKQTVSLLPRGLTNRSNYCYINSILQALLACPPFYNLLSALPHQEPESQNSSTPLIDNMVKFVNEFTALEDGARLPRKDKTQKRGLEVVPNINCGVAFEPSYVYTILKNLSAAGVFSVEGRQEDAEEFLSCLLNGINDEMLEVMKLVSNDTQPLSGITEPSLNNSQEEKEWKVKRPKNKGSTTKCTEFGRTPLSDIFRGQLRSTVLRAGEQHTDNVQPFFTLQLDIRKAESVNEALNILVVRDPLEGMTCSRTKQQIKAWKEVTLEELPVVLILHLKWFDYKYNGCSKISKSVKFPIDLKVDDKLLSASAAKKLSSKQKEYKLFAVTYHDGKEATKGHYVTDAFHVGYQTWVRYDDSSVKCVCKQTVLNPTPPRVPYLLYYRRCDTIGNNQTNNVKLR